MTSHFSLKGHKMLNFLFAFFPGFELNKHCLLLIRGPASFDNQRIREYAGHLFQGLSLTLGLAICSQVLKDITSSKLLFVIVSLS